MNGPSDDGGNGDGFDFGLGSGGGGSGFNFMGGAGGGGQGGAKEGTGGGGFASFFGAAKDKADGGKDGAKGARDEKHILLKSGFLMTMVMTTIQKSSFEREVDQWLTMVDRIIVYKNNGPKQI